MYCQVIVDIVHENVDRPFTYLIPAGLHVEAGQRVTVPFGKQEKEGMVLELTEECSLPPERIRSVCRTLEDYPAVPAELIALAQEMASKNHCPLAETLRLMFPAQMRGERVREKTAAWLVSAMPPETMRQEAEASRKGRRGKRAAILELLADRREMPMAAVNDLIRDPRDAVKQLEADGWIRREDRESLRKPGGSFAPEEKAAFTLTDGQKEALEEILPALRNGTGRFLLHGVTGSGKTEVFLEAVRRTLEADRSAIILVPEIALTPQMVSWFRQRFGTAAAVIHSRLSAGERYDEWRRIRRGEARVVIGARSAVFAPVRDLGLVVVDEEHESSYQSDRNPRYDARDVAVSRCTREKACLILASATPSVQSFSKARSGEYMLLEMPRRVHDQPLPEVEVVDMRRELESGNMTVLSGVLRKALKECVTRNGQAMLLMNRRGYNSFVSCRSCGYTVKCRQCDISMTYHLDGRNSGLLQCHYCGCTIPPPAVCPACGSRYIRYFGAGTQKVEEEVRKLLPDVAIGRMDLDTTGGKDGHAKILETFRRGDTRILIGTQMIAKGLDFPHVTLVGVIAADTTLNLPDYRCRERTFQLLTQVAGRAGRGSLPGRVIVQTYKPEDHVIRLAAEQDYRAFFEEEIQRRRTGFYPPFSMLVRLMVESPSEDDAERAAAEIEPEIRGMLEEHPEWKRKTLLLLRDVPGVRMLRGKHRRQILMKLLTGKESDALCGSLALLTEREWKGSEVWLEINPTTMI